MEHDEATTLLGAYLDQELGVSEALALQRHLDGCAECRAAQAEQRALIARCRGEAPYFHAPARLAQRIAAALPPPTLPAARRRADKASWDFAWLRPAAIAASLCALTIGAGLFLAAPSDQDRLAEELVAGHVRSLQVDHLADVASSDQHTVKPWFNGKIDFAPPVVDLAAQGFRLEGGRLDYVGGHSAAVLVYRHGAHPINVYIWPAAGAAQAPRQRDEQGYHLVQWRAEGMQFWAISDLSREEMAHLVAALRG